MSSPVAHLACGYVAYRTLRVCAPQSTGMSRTELLVAAAFFSLAPDLDFAAGLLAGQVSAFHNNLSHSFAFGALVCWLVAGVACAYRRALRFRPLWLFTFTCYSLHILVDLVTRGRGVMLFWPFTPERFSSSWLLFRGVNWSEGLWYTGHVATLLQDMLFALLLIGLAEALLRLRPIR